MKKMISVIAMVCAAVILSNCSCNPCSGSCAPSDCCGANYSTGNWF